MTAGSALLEALAWLALPGPPLAARDDGMGKLYVYGLLLLGYLVLAAVKAARKRAQEAPRAPPVPREPEDQTRPPAEAPSRHRPPPPPSRGPIVKAPTAAGGGKVARKAYMEQAPEMNATGAAHAAHHEHLADLAATAIRTDAHIGHLVSEKHPGAHPSSVAARTARRSGRALLLARDLSPSERVRAAVLWNAVLTRKPLLRGRRPT